ncbi:MAG: ATP-binding protein, partial [Thaumarchaeota archaeon]|nr:ATP-binding protein [Nitrososphaerota archaeon]
MTANWIKLNGDTELQLFHTLFTGQTNLAGKTTAIRSLIPKAVREDYTVLIFDTKPTVREFEGYHDIPICYRPTTDALALISLLESIRRAKLSILYATLLRITEGAEDVPDIIRNAEKMEAKSKSGFIKDACHTLADLLGRLQNELAGYSLSSTLDIEAGRINVMPLNTLSSEAQQLVIKTAFELALKHHNRRTILVIDEAFRFLPQAYSSACKKPIQDVITQGAKTGLFVWLATQYIATTEKDAIKGMANKLLGRQDDPTEIKATMERIREAKITSDDLMTLKRGEFIFVPVDGQVKKVYIPVSEEMKGTERPREPRKTLPIVLSAGGENAPKRGAGEQPVFERLPQASQPPAEIHLEEKAIVVKVSHSEKVVRETTETPQGMILFVLYSAGQGNELGIKSIVDEAAERGMVLSYENVRKNTLPNMAKDGLVIGDGHGNYRLPRHVR